MARPIPTVVEARFVGGPLDGQKQKVHFLDRIQVALPQNLPVWNWDTDSDMRYASATFEIGTYRVGECLAFHVYEYLFVEPRESVFPDDLPFRKGPPEDRSNA
jgi:hypothetical protein